MKIDLAKLAKNVWFAQSEELIGWGETIIEGPIYSLVPETLMAIEKQCSDIAGFKFGSIEKIRLRRTLFKMKSPQLQLQELNNTMLSCADQQMA